MNRRIRASRTGAYVQDINMVVRQFAPQRLCPATQSEFRGTVLALERDPTMSKHGIDHHHSWTISISKQRRNARVSSTGAKKI